MIAYDQSPYKQGEETQLQREDGHVKTEAEIGAMLPQAKKVLEIPQTGRSKEGFLLETLNGTQPCYPFILDF